SPESLSLMAELLPGSNELRTCLIETVNGQSHRNDNNSEAQRIYAEQFKGDEQALNDLGYAWAPSDAAAPSRPLSSFIYALALGWPDNPALQALLQQDDQPKLPLHIALALCSISGDEKKALACIDRMIDVTSEWGRALPVQYQQGLRKWAFTPSSAALLQKLITDPDGSRVITALRLLNISGRLTNENRIEMIERFNECLGGTAQMLDGIDVLDGKATSIAQAIAQEL
ncbi:MAG: hypothetical protein LUQ57_05975, partial [Methylococcaceae bacterium]|nr:hypothetical protein [Methylococcaceae bacterium]